MTSAVIAGLCTAVVSVGVMTTMSSAATTYSTFNSCPTVTSGAAWQLVDSGPIALAGTNYGLLRLYARSITMSTGTAGTQFCDQIVIATGVAITSSRATLTAANGVSDSASLSAAKTYTEAALIATAGCVTPTGNVIIGTKIAYLALDQQCHGQLTIGYKAKAIAVARKQIGKPYVYATQGPSTFDCSGLVDYSFKQAGHSLGVRTSSSGYQARLTATSNPVPGDLVFFGSPVHHVGIYIGNGKMIDAPHTGAFVREDVISTGFGSPIRYGRT